MNDNYELNYKYLIQQVKNQALNNLIASMIPDDEGGRIAIKFFHAMNKRGVSTQTVIDAFKEIMEDEND